LPMPLDAVLEVRFDEPTWDGYPLDWCLTFENECGKPAADYWCQLNGYDSAIGFNKWESLDTLTKLPLTSEICDPAVHIPCDSFTYITCVTKIV
jgi:hypothetical protein